MVVSMAKRRDTTALHHNAASPWLDGITHYVAAVNQKKTDSAYLRSVGLKKQLIELCGETKNLQVLDVGAGDGWVLDTLQPQRGVMTDIAYGVTQGKNYPFVQADVRHLPFESNTFDLAVASLVLIWLPDLEQAYRELWRVIRPHGRLVVAIVHPYFYRTGHVTPDGSTVVERSLAHPWKIDDLKIGGRGNYFDYYYHPYDEYVMAARRAGLRLETVKDWFIDIDDYKKHVDAEQQIIRRSGLTPLYSFFSFQKEEQ